MSTTIRKAGRFGKLTPKTSYRTLRLSSYLQEILPPRPIEVDNIGRALTALKATEADIPAIWPMDGNDSVGDCVPCGAAHAETLWDAFLGKRAVAAQALVEKVYFQQTGGADTGLNELDFLNYWRKNPFNGSNILAYVTVKASNHDLVKLAIELFGGIYIGLQCTAEMQDQFSAGVPWTPGTLTQDGHCVYVPNYTAADLTCLTWAAAQKMTWAFFDQCADECYCLLPPEAMQPGFNPAFAWAQLDADLKLVTA